MFTTGLIAPGNWIARETNERSDRLEWDENECLSSFYDTGERQTRYQYRYDALRRRISKARINLQGETEQVTYFMWDGDALAAEVSFCPQRSTAESKLDARFFVYYLNSFEPLILQCKQQGIGSLAPQEETGYYFYQNDPNGMPLRLYDAQGEIAWSAHYTIFGQTDKLDETQVKQPLRLQGQYFDDDKFVRNKFEQRVALARRASLMDEASIVVYTITAIGIMTRRPGCLLVRIRLG